MTWIPRGRSVAARRMRFDGRDLLGLSDADRRALVGKDIAMVFQDPLASLNPCFSVAFQLAETLRVHGTDAERSSGRVRRARALELLKQVEIPDAEARLSAFPTSAPNGTKRANRFPVGQRRKRPPRPISFCVGCTIGSISACQPRPVSGCGYIRAMTFRRP